MKKKIVIIFLLSLVAVLAVGGFLYLSYGKGPEVLKATVEKRLKEEYQVETSVKNLSIRYFPMPHVAAEGVVLSHDAGKLSVASIDFYPSILKLLQGKIVLSSVRADNPEISFASIKKLEMILNPPKKGDGMFCSKLNLPEFSISIKNGRAVIPFPSATGKNKKKIKTRDFVLSDILVRVVSEPDGLRVKTGFRSLYTGLLTTRTLLTHENPGPCVWDFTLESETLHIEGARKILTGLYPDNKTVNHILGDLIRSGRFSELAFSFQGTHDEWRNMDRMTGEAQAIGAAIRIPRSSLVLTDIKGPLRLNHGLLSGEKLSAKLGGSTADKGSFDLGLSKNDRRFNLDVVIDADLSGLPDVLDNYIGNAAVKKEYRSIQGMTGRADIRLTMGDSLDRIKTTLSSKNLTLSGYYRRIGRILSITDGEVDVAPDQITWHGLKGAVGPHQVGECSGYFSLGPDKTLDITSLSAGLDSSDLFSYLSGFPAFRKSIGSHLTRADGKIGVKSFTVKGSLGKPGNLAWVLTASADRVGFSSPDLPFDGTASFSYLELSPDKLRFPTVSVAMHDQKYDVSGSLEKNGTGGTSGTVSIRGLIDSHLKPFLRKKGWIPDDCFPNLPVDLDPITFSWSGKEVSLSGLMVKNTADSGPIRVSADMKFREKEIQIPRLTVETDKERAEISTKIPSDKTQSLKVRFGGNVRGKTLSTLLEKAGIYRADMEGYATFTIPRTPKAAFRLSGPVTLSDVHILKNGREALSLQKGRFNGNGATSDIRLTGLSWTSPEPNSGGPAVLSFSRIDGNVSFLPGDNAQVSIYSGNVSGVNFKGDVKLPSLDMDLAFSSDQGNSAKLQDLLSSFGISTTVMTGNLSLEGSITGNPSMISKGAFKIRATNGIVKKDTVLTKIMSILDLTELFHQNPVKNILSSGYRYDSMDIEGTVTSHNVHITKAAIKGAGVNFYATGYIDLEYRTLDLLVLASPFKAVDSIFYHIPIAGPIISGKNKSLLSVPVVVEGHIDRPETRFLPKPVSTVTSGALGLFVDTFKLPFVLTYDLVTSKKTSEGKKGN
jgi:hypothetical protein